MMTKTLVAETHLEPKIPISRSKVIYNYGESGPNLINVTHSTSSFPHSFHTSKTQLPIPREESLASVGTGSPRSSTSVPR